MKSRNKKNRKYFVFGVLVIVVLLILGIKNLAVTPTKMVIPIVALTDQYRFKTLLGEKNIKVMGLEWGERQILATLSGNLVVLFSNNDQLESQVTSLQFILSRSKIEGKSPKRVDLRFDKPVLTF